MLRFSRIDSGPEDRFPDRKHYCVTESKHVMQICFANRINHYRQSHLLCSVNSFRFLGFLIGFVLGPGGLREAPGGPGKAHG